MKNKFIHLLCVLSLIGGIESKGMNHTSGDTATLKEPHIDLKTDQRFDSLKIRAQEVANTPEEIFFLDSMLNLARATDSVRWECQAMGYMARNYYNRMKRDSLVYWTEQLEKPALDHRYYSIFFDAFSLVCSYEMYDKNYDKALDMANRLYLLAKDLDNADGMIASYETIGLIYMETFRYVEAIKSYKEGLELQKQQANPRYGYQFQFMSYIIEAYLKIKDYKNVENSMDQAYEILEKCKTDVKHFPYERCLWLLNCYYIEMYVQQKLPHKAQSYIIDSARFKNIDDFYVFCYYHLVSASYYQLLGNYTEALANVDTVLTQTGEDYLPALKIKAELLLQAGKGQDAASLYHKSINLIDSTYNESMSKQLNQLRTIHEVDKLELRNQQLELETSKNNLRITLIVIAMLLVILTFIVTHYIKVKRMKNLLEKSGKALFLAKEKAEASNRFKDVFLSNLSHEIRTPLNSIVGFSTLLGDMFDKGETKEYASIIRTNSDQLLKLINDTVNISLLQTDQTPFVLANIEVNESCREIIQILSPKVSAHVKLDFRPYADKYMLRTDVTRLRQILENLLLNAIKFTEEGEITLSYKVDQENVQFIVEDTGRGIPQEMQDKIFESFAKVDVFTQGIGLGLTICKLVANRLGGTISLDKAYTKGTRMIFTHPIRK